jgi:SAM-dependent methyltransferase
MSRSCRVRADDFTTEWMAERVTELGETLRIHRKVWEFAVIAQVYAETIGTGGLALGFGCGREPLPAWLANRGCRVLATDQAIEDAKDWVGSKQHSGGLADLPFQGICEEKKFRGLVTYAPMDMNVIPDDFQQGQFDFTWSAGSFEHIGGIEAGMQFFQRQMRCLKPGGMAVHTTEFNFANNDQTLESHNLVLFRRRDLEELERRVNAQGDRMWPLDLERGTRDADLYVDPWPYEGECHLNLAIADHVSTSVLLVARRGG